MSEVINNIFLNINVLKAPTDNADGSAAGFMAIFY